MMKRSFINIDRTAYFLAIGMLALVSCSTKETYDVTGSPENKVYINTKSWSPIDVPHNGFLFEVTNTPVGSTISNADIIEVKFPVQALHKTSSDVHVKMDIDNSLIKEPYTMLPSNVRLSVENTDLTISKGETISRDSLTIKINNDDLALLSPGSYMVPVKISSATNIGLSDRSAAYLLVKSNFTNVTTNVSAVPDGSVINRSEWSVTSLNVWTNPLDNIIDNSISTYGAGNAYPLTFDVDMGADYDHVNGISFRYSNQNYSIVSCNIYSKATADAEYVLQGPATLTRSTTRYVNFHIPFKARYIRVEIRSAYSANNGVRISDFNIYERP